MTYVGVAGQPYGNPNGHHLYDDIVAHQRQIKSRDDYQEFLQVRFFFWFTSFDQHFFFLLLTGLFVYQLPRVPFVLTVIKARLLMGFSFFFRLLCLRMNVFTIKGMTKQ